jgi:hypothetical protein
VALPEAEAPAGIALGIMGSTRPSHHVEVTTLVITVIILKHLFGKLRFNSILLNISNIIFIILLPFMKRMKLGLGDLYAVCACLYVNVCVIPIFEQLIEFHKTS